MFFFLTTIVFVLDIKIFRHRTLFKMNTLIVIFFSGFFKTFNRYGKEFLFTYEENPTKKILLKVENFFTLSVCETTPSRI